MNSFSCLVDVFSAKFLEEVLGTAATDILLVINSSFTFGSFTPLVLNMQQFKAL